MPFEIITIPCDPLADTFHAEELNKFVLNKKIIHRETAFFVRNNVPHWTVFLEYETIIDPAGKEAGSLTEAGKLCYEKLRQWRRETADKEGVPPFVVARNSQLVEIITNEPVSIEALKQINGFGQKKCAKYGAAITDIIRTFFEKETSTT